MNPEQRDVPFPPSSRSAANLSTEEFWAQYHQFWPGDDERFRYFTGGRSAIDQNDHFGLSEPPSVTAEWALKAAKEATVVEVAVPKAKPVVEVFKKPTKPAPVSAAKPKQCGPPRLNGRIPATCTPSFVPTRQYSRSTPYAGRKRGEVTVRDIYQKYYGKSR